MNQCDYLILLCGLLLLNYTQMTLLLVEMCVGPS
jgi:hypothetical protein